MFANRAKAGHKKVNGKTAVNNAYSPFTDFPVRQHLSCDDCMEDETLDLPLLMFYRTHVQTVIVYYYAIRQPP